MRKEDSQVTIRSWATERLSDDIRRSLDRLARSDDVRHIAVMPDVHLSRDVCIGTAFATSHLVYPDAIGGDIGCGISAVAFDAFRFDVSQDRAHQLSRAMRGVVPIQRQRTGAARMLAARVPASADLSVPTLRRFADTEGASQIGTLGTGNHFLELQYDDEEQLWLMVHSGSRGLGQAIRAAHIEFADRSRSGLKFLDVNTSVGDAYLQDMHWARRFAAESRRAMLLAIGAAANNLFGWQLLEDTLFDCDHNHINYEEHFGEAQFVHRKGAMAAWPDVPGIVPGSMAAPSFHVTGRGLAAALCSSAHGAGRAMSRTEARQRVNRTRLLQELRDVYVDPRIVGGLREEAPSAYKNIRAVMKAQRMLVRVRRTLLPILTYKGMAKRQ
ncbi:MAG: RtcB family protein [Phycisphaerales bacterium]